MKKHRKNLLSQKIRKPEDEMDNEANEVEDWDVTTSVFLPPLSSSPKIHTTETARKFYDFTSSGQC
jgi:hypothetical protein